VNGKYNARKRPVSTAGRSSRRQKGTAITIANAAVPNTLDAIRTSTPEPRSAAEQQRPQQGRVAFDVLAGMIPGTESIPFG
jgi:hypothetical protein